MHIKKIHCSECRSAEKHNLLSSLNTYGWFYIFCMWQLYYIATLLLVLHPDGLNITRLELIYHVLSWLMVDLLIKIKWYDCPEYEKHMDHSIGVK